MHTTYNFLVKAGDKDEAINEVNYQLTTDNGDPYFEHLGDDFTVDEDRVVLLTQSDLDLLNTQNHIRPARLYYGEIAEAAINALEDPDRKDELDIAIERYNHRNVPCYPDCTTYNLTNLTRQLPAHIEPGEAWFLVPVDFHSLF